MAKAISEKKLAANRKNAQKSTGPKTEKGKQVVSQNAVKHGLYARALILNSPSLKDDQSEYNNLIYSLDSELEPEGLFEQFLIRQIANCLWRSRRVINAENSQIERQLNTIDSDVRTQVNLGNYLNKTDKNPTPDELKHIRSFCIGVESIPNGEFATQLRRYERRLDNQLSQYLRILDKLQKRRKSTQDKAKKRARKKTLKTREQTQLSGHPVIDNPLKDIV